MRPIFMISEEEHSSFNHKVHGSVGLMLLESKVGVIQSPTRSDWKVYLYEISRPNNEECMHLSNLGLWIK